MYHRKPFRPDPNLRQQEAPFFKAKQATDENDPQQNRSLGPLMNGFGEPAFFQPRQPVQGKFKNAVSSVNPQSAEQFPSAQQDESVSARSTGGSQSTLPNHLKSGLEQLSGEDLSDVRVHENSSEPEKMGAHAYTEGQDIYVAPGQEKYLPHEGWHAVQQKQGRVQPTIQQKSALINDNAGLEHEADVMGAKAVQVGTTGSELNTQKKTASSKNPRAGGTKNVIQRAMKFEYQLKNNFLLRDNGSKVTALPRKYGPRDYLVHLPSGGTLETETSGQVEYETRWEKNWPTLEKQINEMQIASWKMHNAKAVTGSDGNTYKEFPFASQIEHLKKDKGFNMNGGNWARNQKEGEATVKTKKGTGENLRSTTSYAKPDNIVKVIDEGKEVFVHYFSKDQLWARVEYKGTTGWMWSASLKMDSDSFESNADDQGRQTDRPLKSGEKILVQEKDTNWAPYVQISESFDMTQYASFLADYDKTNSKKITNDAWNFLAKQNKEKAPTGEGMFKKLFREYKFIYSHNKLYNLLLMISQTVKSASSRTTLHQVRQPDGSIKMVPGSAKYGLSLLSRTHFGSMFKSMSKEEQALFKKMVKDKKTGILASLGLTTSDKLFMDGTATGFNPTVNKWLEGIAQGNDMLSVQSGNAVPAAMGRFNVNEEKGKHKDLVRFEARNEPDNFPTLGKWDDHAKKHFLNAMAKRKRKTGKGETGLEL